MSGVLASRTSALWFPLRRVAQRIGPLGLIIALHIGLFYALQSGLLRQAAQATLPKVVFAKFITPEQPPQPEAPKPQPVPKTVPVVKKTVTPPPAPVVNPTPSPQAITAPPEQPTPPQPEETPAVAAAPAPPAPAAPSEPRLITSGIEYIQPPKPEYPPISKRMGEEGTVMLRVLVNEKGLPERAEIKESSGSARLDDAARKATMRAVFKPHIEDGRPVTIFAIIPIRFQLDS